MLKHLNYWIKIKPQRAIGAICFAVVALSLACSIPNIFPFGAPTTSATPEPTETQAVPTPTQQALPPAIVEVDPLPGSELPLDGAVTLYFNQPMNRASVEAALKSEPSIQADASWTDDATLSYHPTQALAPESSFTLSLDKSARSKRGQVLLQSVTLEFQTVGYLRMTQSIPEPDTEGVDPTSAVVTAFNRPVVPLGAEPGNLPVAFMVSSQDQQTAQGRGEWVNTSTYIFYPEPGLEGGKTYFVQPNKDLEGIDGSLLAEAGNWSFTTALPRLVSLRPTDGSKAVRLDAPIVLTFNQPMNTTSVETNFKVLDTAAKQVSGKFDWNQDTTVMTYTLNTWLPRESTYTVMLDGQAQARGGTSLSKSLRTRFSTVSKLGVSRTDPPAGGQMKSYGGVSIYLSAPLAEKDINKYISINPPVSNFNSWFNEEDLMFNLYGNFEPVADYTLSLSPDLADPWGGRLGKEFVLRFRTPALPPAFQLTANSEILFLTPQDNNLSVQATNIDKVSLSLGSLTLTDFIAMIGPDGYNYRQGFQASDQVNWWQHLDLAPNRSQLVNLLVTPEGNPLAPGLYYLKYDPDQENTYSGMVLLVVSPVQVTFKLSPTGVFAWAVDLQDKSPVADAPITIYDENGISLASGLTDGNGVFRSEIPTLKDFYSNISAVVSQPGDEDFSLALSNWSQGISGWDFGISSEYSPPQLKVYFYTDRPIYRPGQTVYFRAVARQAFNGRYSMPDLSALQGKLPVTLYGELGQELATMKFSLSAFGTGHDEYILPPNAAPGYYRLATAASEGQELYFQVASYRKPEINLKVEFNMDEVKAGEVITAQVNARYFFDAPAGSLPFHWALYSKPEAFFLPGYQVGKEDTGWLEAFHYPFYGMGLGELITENDAKTRTDGTMMIELPTEPVDARCILTLEITAQDESGLPVSARNTLTLHPASFYIGARPDQWVGKASQQMGFSIQVVDWEGNPAGVHNLRGIFQKVVWVEKQPTDRFVEGPMFVPQYTLIGSMDFTTDGMGQARLAFTPPEAGTYQLDITGDSARTEVLLWVGGAGQIVWPNLPNQRLRLTAEKESYKPGDAANIFIPNPFGTSAIALITVERSIILRHQVLTLEPGGSTLNLPLTEEDTPNVYVSVTVIGQTVEGRPDFRQGYLQLIVKSSIQILNVSLTSQPERTAPGQEVTFDVRVTDSAGNPVQGEFSLSVVDLAVLALADPNAPDIAPAFYGNQPLSVKTGLGLAVYANRLAYFAAGIGGGGGEEMPSVVREHFPDTAYWNAEIVTDADGRAHVSLPLPDTLTTWQVDVRGLTIDTRVGQAQGQVVTTKDLLVRPVVPRFFVEGDRVQLAAIAQNNTLEDLQVEVSIEANGFNLDDATSSLQIVNIPAEGRARVEWWGTVQNVEAVDLVFSATSGELQDATRPAMGKIPVLHYNAPQTFSTSGVMEEGGERLELVSLPRSFDNSGGGLSLELSPSLAAIMVKALDVLEHYPYECTEQTLSRFLPNLETYRTLKKLGIESPDIQARLERTLDEGLQRLMAQQNLDGGWGWWRGGESDPYLTAYVLFGLERAQEASIETSDPAIQKAVDYLRAGLVTPKMLKETWQLDRLAFIHFALAEAGEGDLVGAENLYRVRDQLNPWAQGLLALTLESLSPGNKSTSTLVSDLEATAIRTATGAHWEDEDPSWQNMTTPVSASAMVLYALAQRDPTSPLAADVVRYLIMHRRAGGAWDSTYSTAWTLMALNRVVEATGEYRADFAFSATLNDSPFAEGQAGGVDQIMPMTAEAPISTLYPRDANALVIRRAAGAGRLYYTSSLRVYRPVDEAPPLQRGIQVSRLYYPTGKECPKQKCKAIEGTATGMLVKVRLMLTLQNDAYYLVVEDYLPAGAEALDTSLKTSQQGLPEQRPPLYDPQRLFDEGWGWWYFSQQSIYDDHVTWAADYLPAGTYELTYYLTALQAGEYRLLPARAWQFYFPEVQGNSAGDIFIIGK